MTTLVFMRHGQTEWNRAGRYLSRTDISIDGIGAADVRASAPALRNISSAFFVSSPLSRAMETATIVSDVLGLPNAQTWDDLREIDFGVFEGETDASALRGPYAKEYPLWRDPSSGNLGPPEGDLWSAVDTRAKSVLASLEEQGSDALVVSHGCFIRAVLAHAVLGLPSINLRRFRLDNAAFMVLSGSPSKWVVSGINVRVLT